MGLTLKILLAVDTVLLVALLIYVIARLVKEKKVDACVTPEQTDNPKQTTVDTEEQVEKVIEKEVVVTTTAEPELKEEVKSNSTVVIGDVEDDRDIVKRIPFSEKMLSLDSKTQSYYNELYNKFISMRRINPRVSTKCVSFRLGKELVAKISVRGKTMKLNLALDVSKFEENIYFQKDSSDVKTYAEVPFTVKVKSDRGLKNAIKLIDALATEKNIENKVRYNAVDAIAELKELSENK